MEKHNHKIEYRYYTDSAERQNRGASGWQEINIVLQEKLRTGDRNWESKVKNLIASNTGINAEDVIQCKIEWLGQVEESVSTKSDNESSKSKMPSTDFKDTALGSGMSSMGKGIQNVSSDLAKRSQNRKKAEKIELEEKISAITSIEFKSKTEEVQQQIEELITQGISMSAKHLPVRKAAYSKVMLGISRLKSSGEMQIASALEEQAKELKPKIWHIIANFLE